MVSCVGKIPNWLTLALPTIWMRLAASRMIHSARCSGAKSVNTVGNTNLQSVTILPCVCADGTSLPICILLKGTAEGKEPR